MGRYSRFHIFLVRRCRRVVGSRSSWHLVQRRFRHAQRENRTQFDEPRRQDDKVGRHDTFAVGAQRAVQARRGGIPALVCRQFLCGDGAPTISPLDCTHDVGLGCKLQPVPRAWSFVVCSSREFVCALAAHGHREELEHQRLGVVTRFSQPDGVSEKLGQ